MLYMTDVRSYYVETVPTTPLELISFANGFRRRNIDPINNSWRSDYALDIWRRACNLIPEKYRLFGPEHYGDAVIHSTRATPTLRRRTKGGGRVACEAGPGDWQSRWKPLADIDTSDVQIKILSEHTVKELTFSNVVKQHKVSPDSIFRYVSYHGLWGAGIRRVVDPTGKCSDILVADWASPEHSFRKNARFSYQKSFASDSPITQLRELWVPFYEQPLVGAIASEVIDPDAIYRQFAHANARAKVRRKERELEQLHHVRNQLIAAMKVIAKSRDTADAHIEKLIGDLKN